MKIEAKNLTRSPALVFFLIMGIRSVYTLSVTLSHILPKNGLDWSIISSVMSTFTPFIIAAALFFRIPKLLYLSSAVSVVLILCSTVLEFAEWFAVGYVTGAELLLFLMHLLKIAVDLCIAFMVYRFGKMQKLWFLPLLLYLASYTVYILHILVLVAGHSTMSLWSVFFNLILTVPAYGFLGYWLAHPYKRSYLLKLQNTSEKEEHTNA